MTKTPKKLTLTSLRKKAPKVPSHTCIGIDKYVKEFTSKRAIGKSGYLTQVGLVPLANPKEAISQVK